MSAGALGPVLLAESVGIEPPATIDVAPWLRTDASLGGVLIAQATHPLYVLRSLLGEPTRVTASAGAATLDMACEDTAALIVGFRTGAMASLIATFAAAPGSGEHAIRLVGRTGTLRATTREGTHQRPERLYGVLDDQFGDTEWHEFPLPVSDGWITSFQRMWEDYADALHDGTSALVSGEDGREVVRIVRAAYASIDQASTVALPYPGHAPA